MRGLEGPHGTSRRMRILFLAPQPFLEDRGTPLRARNVLRVLTEAGHHVDLLCYPFGRDLTLPGLRIFRCWKVPGIRRVGIGPTRAKLCQDIPFAWSMALRLWRRRYDVVHAVEEAGLFAALWPRRGARLVYQMDSYISEQLVYSGFATRGIPLALARWMEAKAMAVAALVIAVGPDHADEVRRRVGHERVLVLPDTAPEDVFQPDEAGARDWRERLGLARTPCVLYTGNFEPYQGVEILVQAAGILASAGLEFRAVLVGGRPEQVEALRQLAGAVGAGKTCVFVGARPAHEMRTWLTLADVLASPRCRGRNPPMKIYTYMQTGRPIVATRVPTHTQVLHDGIAFLAQPEPRDLARAIREALTDWNRAAQVGQNAKLEFERCYSFARFRDRILSAYSALA